MNLVNCDKYTHLQGLKNNFCSENLKPEILIGQDYYHLQLPLEIVIGSPEEPCATRTPLGWCIHGRTPGASSAAPAVHSTLFICHSDVTDDDASETKRLLQDLHEEVRRSFTYDSLGVTSKPRENYNDVCVVKKLDKTSKLVNGRWYVGLPWKNEQCELPDSFPHATSRLKGVERKMEKCDGYRERYNERVQHLFDNDYAQELKDTAVTSKTWYLPHFGVDNKNKKRLRLVFDCAAETNGLSLNHYLLKGPDLLRSLFGIMLRFREQRIGVTADIKDMFLRVKIREEDQNALRFLYRSDPKGPVNTYVMTSLIFGANCSPFVAQYIKNKNAQRFEPTMLPACEAIYNQHYVDDYIDSLPDEKTAIELIRDIKSIHQQGGFELRNWTSNSKQVLESMPKSTLGEAAVKFKTGEQYESERTLGLIWFPHEDVLGFDVSFKKIPENIINGTQRPTKRDILRVVMSIFDVYGFLSPFTVHGKMIIQLCWQENIDWDMEIPNTIYEKWCKWISCLKSLRNIRLPRFYHNAAHTKPTGAKETDSIATAAGTSSARDKDGAQDKDEARAHVHPLDLEPPPVDSTTDYANLELHLFCDSSSKAMCAVAYWRWESNAHVYVAFVASKCRIAANKITSIPRLELNSAVLAARLADTIIKEHKIKPIRKIFWSDSTTTLHWIRNKCRTYKPYIANRLGEIDELTCSDEWRYVPTNLNIADVGTRETYEESILQGQWLHGPVFLCDNERTWPKDCLQPVINENELECVNIIQMVNDEIPIPEPARFSSWLRLLRSTHAVLKFIKGCRKLTDNNNETMEEAERLLIRQSQAQSFSDEIKILKEGKYIEKNSKLLTLSPYLDEYGVLRVGGRIDDAADVSPETKRPIILDGKDYITRLIVKSYHVSAAHQNQETVVNNLKQKYWITKLRPTVKNIASKCMICRIKKSRPEIPRMGNLPEARMAHHQRPFTFCGIDLFGPQEVAIGRRREKRYGVIFTCLTVRAIHLETVASLTTDALIMALRRMAARRGWPQQIFSDNGTNLRGADVELKRALQELKNNDEVRNAAMNHGTKWTFIPAASPHWAGAWERMIRSVKASLKIVLKERAPREETYNTLLAEVENIVNSRPLTHVSVEAGSAVTLTPNHFLLGSSSNLPQMGIFDNSEFFLRKQWRIAQRLADLYWKRWVREVLPDLLPRQKWNKEQRPLQVGDLVLIVDPDGPRNVWPRGIIEQTLPGRDGRTRMVRIRTKTGVLTRSAARVARIPVGEECC
ncbi:uncharacterized protein LOC125227843 [Leguminivora glycinivorella]|uniref:uncharacterized protein LOC125227843 n=1 Tax=Leguminivora glycinivorella TaxID=1035111 RepID=UPI00200D49BE|nr:uncharacterized protein LOC125227843 [Leguminivora glycinivorella]